VKSVENAVEPMLTTENLPVKQKPRITAVLVVVVVVVVVAATLSSTVDSCRITS